MIALHNADAAKRFGEAAGNFGVDLGTRAENGADGGEGFINQQPEGEQDAERNERHQGADAQQNDQRQGASHQTAEKLDQASANQVADAFDIAHDARDQFAGLVRIVIIDGKTADMGLDALAHIGDHALRRFGKKLSERKRSDALNDGCGDDDEHDRQQQIGLVFADHIIEKIFRREGQCQAGDPVDGH